MPYAGSMAVPRTGQPIPANKLVLKQPLAVKAFTGHVLSMNEITFKYSVRVEDEGSRRVAI